MSSKPHESDSEDDPDYAPSVGADESSEEDSGPETKKARTASPGATAEDEAANRKAREELWATFQASISDAPPAQTQESPKRMVKVEKRYLFAGENVIEVVEVLEDSADAKKWPLWRPPGQEPSSSVSASSESLSVEAESNVVVSAAMARPSSKRPGPRKSRTSLTSLPTPSQKAKKLSTLDKSAMDWQAHINTEQDKSGLRDELEANRRGGGYLEKVDFLKRVEERKEGAMEASKSSKRRRP